MEKIFCTAALVIILGISSGFAYRCYECQEEKGKGLQCELNVRNVLQSNCTEGFQCIKYIWTTNKISMIYRGCAPRSKCEELGATGTSNHTLDYCQLCDSPLCNSGPKLQLTLFVFIPMLLLLSKSIGFSILE